jgi:signal transduction histidine kinase/ActR/RegA family two-component response regulator
MVSGIGLGANHPMADISLQRLERPQFRVLDVLAGVLVAVGIVGLFVIDISEPRGIVDGVGYAAIVALCIRFGGRAIIGCAVLTTILTVAGSFLVPDAGVSVAGSWANRGFAIAEIWIVAAILLHRLRLETFIAARESVTQATQTALGKIVREALLAAETLQTDSCCIVRERGNTGLIRVVDFWDRRHGRHLEIPDHPANDAPEFLETMQQDFVILADDILTSPLYKSRLSYFKSLGIRAHLVAETFPHDRSLGAIAFGFSEPHHWTAQEIAFARALANLVALLFSAGRNAEILATLELVSEGIYAEDSSGAVLYANRTARNYAAGEDGEPSRNFPRPPVALTGVSDMHELSSKGRDLEIQRMRLPDGGMLTRINDVTVRNATLSERRQMEARLQQSAKMEAIGQLAGGVAHDFNNILGSILGFAGFLEQDLPERSAERGFAERILSACERGKNLVEQILAFARARSVERGVVDLGLLVDRNRAFLGGLLPEQVALNVRPPDTPLPVFGSAVQIGQLIANLCLNARDALEGRNGTINIATRPATALEIEALKKGAKEPTERVFGDVRIARTYCLLRVEDNGPGIEPGILDRIFEPFFTTKGRQRGTGLGLAVVHGVVESCGGVCHVKSMPGKGTVFSVYFPFASEPAGVASEAVLEPQDLRGHERVLIVDDERDIADMLVIGLERLGYETVGVNDPLEALAAVAEDPDAFDVMVTDQVMPGMRGLDLIRRVKKIKPGIKTVLCTGYSDGANEEVSREAGADAFFHKPADARQIARGLRNFSDRNGDE